MKKTFSLVMIILNLFLLSGCNNELSLEDIYFDNVNYNNLTNSFTDIFVDDNTVFYYYSGLFSNQIRMYKDGKRKTILLNNLAFSNETLYDYVFIEDFIYFSTYNDTTEQDSIYKYYLSTKTYEKIITTTYISSWMGTKDFIAYSKYYDSKGLYVYDIKNKTEMLVLEGNTEFCVVNNKVRYITTDGNKLHKIYEFDLATNKSQKIGEFSLEYESDLLSYNFTSNYIVVSDYEINNNITVWSTNSKVYKYTLPLPIQQIIAGENFAYALCYESEEFSSSAIDHKYNGIYKIDLSSGDYEKIYDYADDDTDIYTYSDSIIYISRFEFHFWRGFHSTLYKYDDNSEETIELFRY